MRRLEKALYALTLSAILFLPFPTLVWAEELVTNEAVFTNPPGWLNQIRVNHVVEKIQAVMEWDIRKVRVQWYSDQAAFQKFHGFDASVLAISKKADHTIHLGPRVTAQNFDSVFGHELVHTIIFQKYKDAIPKWLDEGLANYVARQGQVDYAWLNTQPTIDVRTLVHPFQKPLESTALPPAPPSPSPSPSAAALAGDNLRMRKGIRFLNPPTPSPSVGPLEVNPRYHYQASTALIEMIAAQCSLEDLLQLSVGKKLETYLETFCRIPDINSSFQAWVKKKASH